MHTANSASFNEYDFDDEDEASGLVGFIKRHKILTALATTATCASIVIYNNPTLWDTCVAWATSVNTLKNDVLEGLRSDDSKQQGKDQTLPAEKNETKKPQEVHQEKPNVSKPGPVEIGDQNKKKKAKLNPMDRWNKNREVYRNADKLAATIGENATLKGEKDGLKADNVGEAKISINSLRFNCSEVEAIKEKLSEEEQKLFEVVETEIKALEKKEKVFCELSSAKDQALMVEQELKPHFDRIIKKCAKLREKFKIVIGSELVKSKSKYEAFAGGAGTTLLAVLGFILFFWK